ncbi:MAG TPA: DNA polymerase III subunit delta [Lacipirellulaceae bacterium]|jgi:DNA polymerase-3 subunit delta|nr:DNA polymerase III subunit delta [Lacipirellulaceae bacterium]
MAKASAKAGVVSALDYLANPEKHPLAGVCAVYGDDAFLKSEVLGALRGHILKGEESDFGLSTFTGREVRLRDVHDALATVSLFGTGQRLVIIEEADPFVSEFRSELEDYVAKPARGVLVLDVKTWPSNTRLAKAVAAKGLTIQCDAPNARQMKSWLTQRARGVHDVRLDAAAADLLQELVPPELGILVQEVAKLALLVDEKRVIDVELVRKNVGGWRTRATWDMVDAAADGRAADALAQLDRLLTSGEKPHGLLPQMASTLRRFATAVDLIDAAATDRRRLPTRDALAQAGVLPFKLADAERQLRQIGRRRASQLTQWLLAADLAIKSHNSSDDRARVELERLIVQLSGAAGAVGAMPRAAAAR